MNLPADIVVIDITSKKYKIYYSIDDSIQIKIIVLIFADIINTVTDEGNVTNERF